MRFSIAGPWRYQIFWEVTGLEQGPLSLVSRTEELLGRNSSGSGLKSREYGRKEPLCWPSDVYPQKLTLTSPTSGDRSVGIVRGLRPGLLYIFFLLHWILLDEFNCGPRNYHCRDRSNQTLRILQYESLVQCTIISHIKIALDKVQIGRGFYSPWGHWIFFFSGSGTGSTQPREYN
jgi:hypothetical protein